MVLYVCGIAGFYQSGESESESLGSIALRMAGSLSHRGPDAEGVWSDPGFGLALSHRRLSILDLSNAGAQPMHSETGRYVISYNGEIYNHLDLRAELSGYKSHWQGSSDTETLLACIECWGIKKTLKKSIGMFAFAVWDRQEHKLTLSRDRLGEKPLYYGHQRGSFVFASELKAIQAHPAFENVINHEAVSLLFRFNYIPAPYSVYKGIYKLPPGCFIEINDLECQSEPKKYWDIESIARNSVQTELSAEEACGQLKFLLKSVIQQQMLSDVPLGALLSGGIDSSLVCALMQSRSSAPINTFTIGFDESSYNEAAQAREIANHLGTNHTEVILSSSDCIDLVPSIAGVYDEPFADSSQLPTSLVMQIASSKVKVALSGDGGDEIFAGYTRYSQVPRVWSKICWMPEGLRQVISKILTAVPARTLNALLLQSKNFSQLGDKLHKLGHRIDNLKHMDDLYWRLITEWHEGLPVKTNSSFDNMGLWRAMPLLEDPASRMMVMDSQTYLPDDILVKVDRAAMASSLETRAPYLDSRVVDFAWNLGIQHKLSGNTGKHILNKLLKQYIPAELMDKPKQGFAIPLDQWLRGPLRSWAEDLLATPRLTQSSSIDIGKVLECWNKHQQGASYGYRLWSVLMFLSWLENRP